MRTPVTGLRLIPKRTGPSMSCAGCDSLWLVEEKQIIPVEDVAPGTIFTHPERATKTQYLYRCANPKCSTNRAPKGRPPKPKNELTEKGTHGNR